MYFEVYNKGKLIRRGKETLNDISFSNELMFVPTCELVLPAEWIHYFDGREEVKIFVRDKVFWGIVWDLEVDKVEETLTVSLRHVISEWEYRQISVNHAMSNKDLNIVFKGDEIEVSEQNDETITAGNFTILVKKIDKMTDAQYIAKANAVAWQTSSGNPVAVTKVDTSKIKKEEGTYNVTFSTAKGTSVTVECEVSESINYETQKTKSNKTNQETIAATPFNALTDAGLTAEKVKKKVKAKAWVYKHKDQEVDVTSITTDFENKPGEYTVTASTARGTSITVTITVEDGQSYDNVNDPSVVDKLEDIYADKNFAYPGWVINFQGNSGKEMIDYVYSRQNKLEALTQSMELTPDLFWRVNFINQKKVEIGTFGAVKPYIFSIKPPGKTNIQILEEPSIDYNFDNVINVATVYSDKSDSGMSSVTLRDIYNNPSAYQKDGFPVVILHANVNNERDYTRYVSQFPALAPNNELEYAVLDEASIALESGTIIEGTYSFNDLSPFELDGKRVTDTKRIQVEKIVYGRAIRKLVQARRSYSITLTTTAIPNNVFVGDKVRLLYDNNIWNLDACSNYWKKILSYNDYFIITAIEYSYDSEENETCHVTLAKWVRIDRETQND